MSQSNDNCTVDPLKVFCTPECHQHEVGFKVAAFVIKKDNNLRLKCSYFTFSGQTALNRDKFIGRHFYLSARVGHPFKVAVVDSSTL